MKISLPLALLFVSWSAVAFAQVVPATPAPAARPPLGPPVLTLAKRSENGQTLEIQKAASEFVPQTYTVQVPETVTEEVNGEQRTKTVYRTEQRTRMAAVTKLVCIPCALDSIEVRTLKGEKFKPEDMATLFDEEFRPVIAVERQVTMIDGKEVMRAVRFDPQYLKVFQPDTLLVFLPPPTAQSFVPAAVPQPTLRPGSIERVPNPTPAEK